MEGFSGNSVPDEQTFSSAKPPNPSAITSANKFIESGKEKRKIEEVEECVDLMEPSAKRVHCSPCDVSSIKKNNELLVAENIKLKNIAQMQGKKVQELEEKLYLLSKILKDPGKCALLSKKLQVPNAAVIRYGFGENK